MGGGDEERREEEGEGRGESKRRDTGRGLAKGGRLRHGLRGMDTPAACSPKSCGHQALHYYSSSTVRRLYRKEGNSLLQSTSLHRSGHSSFMGMVEAEYTITNLFILLEINSQIA